MFEVLVINVIIFFYQILKDITNRYKLLRGYNINYIPGWDCHGLPIELKAVRDRKRGILTDPKSIRDAARSVVDDSIKNHIQAFKRWGILAEWNSPYKTLDKSYIKTQLQSFLELYNRGLVFRDMKPVYWSPSSKYDQAKANKVKLPSINCLGFTEQPLQKQNLNTSRITRVLPFSYP